MLKLFVLWGFLLFFSSVNMCKSLFDFKKITTKQHRSKILIAEI